MNRLAMTAVAWLALRHADEIIPELGNLWEEEPDSSGLRSARDSASLSRDAKLWRGLSRIHFIQQGWMPSNHLRDNTSPIRLQRSPHAGDNERHGHASRNFPGWLEPKEADSASKSSWSQ